MRRRLAGILLVLPAVLAPAAGAAPKPFLDTRDAPARSTLGVQSTPEKGRRVDIAAGFVAGHLRRLGLTRDDLGSLRAQPPVPIPGGATQVAYAQSVEGVPAFGAGLRVTIDRAGRVIETSGRPVHDPSLNTTEPKLTGAQAIDRLRSNVGAAAGAPATGKPELVAFGDRLGWHVDLVAGPLEHYAAVVDAVTGKVLYRANRVKTAANDALVWDQYPGAPNGGAQHLVDLTPWLNPGATDLSGPYAHAWPDLNDNDTSNIDANGHIVPLDAPSTGEAVTRTGTGGSFSFTFDPFTLTENPNGGCTNGAGPQCSWDFETNGSSAVNRAQNAVQAFYYVNRFRDHLFAAPISFTPADGNFDDGDRILVNTDDGASTGPGGNRPDANHTDNAYMDTPPNGTSPTMAMFLFGSSLDFREVNGGDDAAIVYHEYTHGLSSRLITVNPSGGEQALNSVQAGAMGEAWSDFYAKDFIVDQFPSEDTAAPGEVDMGDYVDLTPHSIRSQALDCPVSTDPAVTSACPGAGLAGAGGYTYSDLGKIAGGNEVHADGEIWGETLWDLRDAVGSEVAEAIVTQGMRLTPPEPKFLDARSAIVQADAQLYPYGDHSDQIWNVFAKRGMGTNALSPTAGTAIDGSKVPPAAKLGAGSAVAGQPVTIDASGSVDRDGSVASYDFDFNGDGTYEVTGTTTPQQTTTYANPGVVHPAVRVHDNEGQVDTAAAEVTVAAPPQPTVTPTPTPTATPTVTPSPKPSAAPKVKFTRTGRKGRATVSVTCDSACRGTVTITVQAKTARKLGLGSKRTVAKASFRLTKAGTKKVVVRLSGKARKGMARKRVSAVATRVTVRVKDAEGQSATPSRSVRIRRT